MVTSAAALVDSLSNEHLSDQDSAFCNEDTSRSLCLNNAIDGANGGAPESKTAAESPRT